MPVIKAASAVSMLKSAVVLDLGDVARQAERIRAVAEDRARRIITAAEARARQLIESASAQGQEHGRAEGLQKGLAEGRQKGRAEALAQSGKQLQELQAAWLAAAGHWERHRQDLDRQAREAVLELALRLTEKIVHRVIQVDRQVIVDQVATALAHVLGATDVSVRISPTDRPTLEEAMPQLLGEFANLKHVRIVDDPAIAAGGCVVTYGQGRIDAMLDTQLHRIVDLMLPGEEEGEKGQGAEKSEEHP